LTTSGVRARRITKSMAKFSCEMRIVAKAAGISDLVERLTCIQQRTAMQQMPGMVQSNRIDEFAAGGAALGK
jgi:hypothetical protein